MTRRRLFLGFLFYLTLDLSNPFVAGAFNFNPDECVDGIHRAGGAHGDLAAVARATACGGPLHRARVARRVA
jgi:hypothetical protein